jgi:hypothetical protein
MKCFYHPNKDATVQCSQCKKPLCDQCAIPERGKVFICSGCAALKAAQDMVQGIDQRLEEKEEKIQIQEAKKKKRIKLSRIILLSIAVAIVVVNLLLYFYATMPEEEKFNPSEHPTAAAIIIDQAIRDYSKDHEGKYPQRLDELLGKYIPSEGIMPSGLEDFSYRKISPNSYELRPEKLDAELMPDLVFTEGGPKL